jgi:hypothetical protein
MDLLPSTKYLTGYVGMKTPPLFISYLESGPSTPSIISGAAGFATFALKWTAYTQNPAPGAID